jgi:hypothetical protein
VSEDANTPHDSRVARLEEMTSVRFPVRDDDDPSRVVWFCLEPSAYGLTVTVHRDDPGDDPSPVAGMACVHVDFFDDRVAVQLWDEEQGPGGEIHWRTPSGVAVVDEWPCGASIVLVHRVRNWHPPTAQAQG